MVNAVISLKKSNIHKSIKLVQTLLLLLSIPVHSVFGETLDKPSEQVVLKVFGNIQLTNVDGQAHFDRSMLLALAETKIDTRTPWTDGVSSFQGPRIKVLLELLKAEGDELVATALNGYRIIIPMRDIDSYPVILALKRNERILSVRKKGPSWVIYPWTDNEELQGNLYYSRSIWQLKSLEVR